MNKFRRLLICLLILTLLPAGGAVSAAEEKVESVGSYDVGIGLLSAIGVVGDSDLARDENEPITRAELAMLAVRLRGWEKVAHERTDARYFYDVDPEYYETRYINLAVSSGLMTSDTLTYFAPAEAVSYEEAARTVMTVLGYKPMVIASGGENTDYIMLASQKGLMKGLEGKSGSITRSDMYLMLVNSLKAGVLRETAYGTNAKYRSTKDRTLLTEYHNILTDEGVMTADDISGLNAEGGKAGRGMVEIDGIEYSTSNAAHHELLGYNVEFYYKTDNNENELVYAFKVENKELVLKPLDIADFSNLTYTYINEKEREKEAKTAGAYFVYNGIAMSGGNDDFVPSSGHVELIDNDNNGVYDVVKIFSYEEYKVEGVISADDVIKTESNARLELERDKVRLINSAFNKEISLEDIKTGSVISVGRDSGGDIARIVVSQSHIIGEVSQLRREDPWTVVINDIPYTVSAALQAAIEAGEEKEFEFGLMSRFDLNYENEIAFWDNNYKQIGEDSWEFGLLYGAARDGVFAQTVKLRIITSVNQFDIFNIVDKVTVDDVPYTDMDVVYSLFCRDGENGALQEKPVSQLIRFKLRADGTVSHVDLVGDENPAAEGLFKVATYNNTDYDMYYSTQGMSLRGEVPISLNTALFIYPETGGRMDLSDEDRVVYYRASDYFKNITGYNNFTTYKVSSEQLPVSVICMSGEAKQELNAGAYLNILLNKTTVMGPDGEAVTQLTYAQDTREIKTAIVSENIDLDNIPHAYGGGTHALKKGDAFRCTVDSFGEITFIQPVYDYENHAPLGINYNSTTTADTGYLRTRESEQFYVGYAYKLEEDVLMGTYALPYNAGDKSFAYNISKAQVLVYDSKTDTLTVGSQNDIYDYIGSGNDCTKLVIRTHWYDLYQLFVIK